MNSEHWAARLRVNINNMEQFPNNNVNNESQEQTVNDRLLMAKYFFGDQGTSSSRSELGQWLQSNPEGKDLNYENKSPSMSTWFRINKEEDLHTRIDIRLDPFDSSAVGEPFISVTVTAPSKEKESNIFMFNKESLEDLKQYVGEHLNIFNNPDSI